MKGYSIPRNVTGNQMSPYETATGVILPLWAPPGNYRKSNRHHAHYYENQFKNGPQHMRAVRFSRLQRVDRRLHQAYHDSFDGTHFPTPGEAFDVTLLNVARYIPRFAVDMTRGCPDIIELSRKQKAELRKPKVLTIEDDPHHVRDVGRYLMDYAVALDLSTEKQKEVEEFVSLMRAGLDDTSRQHRLEQLGMDLTDTAIGLAVSPLEGVYRRARQNLYLCEGAPITAFAALKSFVRGHEADYFGALAERQAAHIGAMALG